MRIYKPLVVLAATLVAAGCVSTTDFEAAQRQISELQEELANIKRTASSKDEVQNVNVRIAEQTETLLKSNATLVAKVSEIEERIQTTQGSVEQATYRIDQVAQQVSQDAARRRRAAHADDAMQTAAAAATTTDGGGAASGELTVPGATAAPTVDPEQTYQAAYRDYQRGNFDLAIEGFREFLSKREFGPGGQRQLLDRREPFLAEEISGGHCAV
jgi:TolA-binding protein